MSDTEPTHSVTTEIAALMAVLPDALARQWSPSPVPKPREDTPQRASGDRASDPTADTVLDARRLAVREAVLRAERELLRAAHWPPSLGIVNGLRIARRGVERAVARFDGEDA